MAKKPIIKPTSPEVKQLRNLIGIENEMYLIGYIKKMKFGTIEQYLGMKINNASGDNGVWSSIELQTIADDILKDKENWSLKK